jgi:hypothetical protein
MLIYNLCPHAQFLIDSTKATLRLDFYVTWHEIPLIFSLCEHASGGLTQCYIIRAGDAPALTQSTQWVSSLRRRDKSRALFSRSDRRPQLSPQSHIAARSECALIKNNYTHSLRRIVRQKGKKWNRHCGAHKFSAHRSSNC